MADETTKDIEHEVEEVIQRIRQLEKGKTVGVWNGVSPEVRQRVLDKFFEDWQNQQLAPEFVNPVLILSPERNQLTVDDYLKPFIAQQIDEELRARGYAPNGTGGTPPVEDNAPATPEAPPPPPDTIRLTDEEARRGVTFNIQIAALQGQIVALQGQIDGLIQASQAHAEQMRAKYKVGGDYQLTDWIGGFARVKKE